MAKKKQKYYVVWKGVNPGVYDSWPKCQEQIKGFPGAVFKSFKSKSEADEAYFDNVSDHIKRKSASSRPVSKDMFPEIIQESISVDAACSGNPGIMEYRGVFTSDAVEIFKQGPFQHGTNNVGEFLALVHALAYCKQKGWEDKTIYSDSRIAMGWVLKKKCKTKLAKKESNKIIFDLITRAETWLKNNVTTQTVLKWETKKWGEIPADFGRK